MSLPLLEHTGRLVAAVERRNHTLGFGGACHPDGGRRDELFAAFASRLSELFAGLFDMPVREAWVEATEILEDADVRWAYLRAGSGTYHERLRAAEPGGPAADETFYTASGTC